MSNTRMVYFEKEDIIHLSISDEPETGSIELSPNVTAELNAKGELIGIEIINASAFLRDSILESVQAKLLDLSGKQTLAKSALVTHLKRDNPTLGAPASSPA